MKQPAYRVSERLSLHVRATPSATPAIADVYIAIQLPDKTLLFLQTDGTLTKEVSPIARNWTIEPFSGEIFQATFSNDTPVGHYTWLGAFTDPGTIDIVGDIAQASFTFLASDLAPCAPPDWSVIGSGEGQWQCSGETLLAHSSAGDSILASSTTYTDVTLSAVVSSLNREAGLAVRMQDAANGYIIIFLPDGIAWNNGQGGIWVARRVSYQETYLAYYHEPGFPSLGELAQLSVSANGPVIKVSLNGREVLQVTDATHASGRIGLRIYGDEIFPCDSTFADITFP